jgi:predicted SAM-dependent methyltransferase
VLRVNVGCGQTPTLGWRNYDNSPSLRLSRVPFLPEALRRVNLLDARQYAFIQFARVHSIEYGNAATRLPLPAESVDVLYSSHMLEHLDRQEVLSFLAEAQRVLRPRGTLRLAVPDLRRHVNRYLESGDADGFVAATELTQPRKKPLAQRLKALLAGSRNHLWMYDGKSLTRLLDSAAFVDIHVLEAGQTTINGPDALDLHERSDESVYLEAKKP